MKKYIVREGDTMWSISKETGVRLNMLMAANPQIADPNRLSPGQVLSIPELNKPAGLGAMPPTGTTPAAIPETMPGAMPGTTPGMMPGMMPPSPSGPAETGGVGHQSAAAVGGPEQFTASAKNGYMPPYFGFVWPHVVQKGETWETIAGNYNVQVSLLKDMNPAHKKGLKEGDIVYVPATAGMQWAKAKQAIPASASGMASATPGQPQVPGYGSGMGQPGAGQMAPGQVPGQPWEPGAGQVPGQTGASGTYPMQSPYGLPGLPAPMPGMGGTPSGAPGVTSPGAQQPYPVPSPFPTAEPGMTSQAGMPRQAMTSEQTPYGMPPQGMTPYGYGMPYQMPPYYPGFIPNPQYYRGVPPMPYPAPYGIPYRSAGHYPAYPQWYDMRVPYNWVGDEDESSSWDSDLDSDFSMRSAGAATSGPETGRGNAGYFGANHRAQGGGHPGSAKSDRES